MCQFIQIQVVRLILGAVLEWNFSKLQASNVGHGGNGVGVTGHSRGQVATDCRNVLEYFIRVPWNVLGFH